MLSNKTTIVNSYLGAFFITLVASGATMFILHVLNTNTLSGFTATNPADVIQDF